MKKLTYLLLLLMCSCSKEKSLETNDAKTIQEKFATAKINVLFYDHIILDDDVNVELVDIDFAPEPSTPGFSKTKGTSITIKGKKYHNIVQFVSDEKISDSEMKEIILNSYRTSLRKKNKSGASLTGVLSYFSLEKNLFRAEYFTNGMFEVTMINPNPSTLTSEPSKSSTNQKRKVAENDSNQVDWYFVNRYYDPSGVMIEVEKTFMYTTDAGEVADNNKNTETGNK